MSRVKGRPQGRPFFEFDDLTTAEQAAKPHPWSKALRAHDHIWLLVIGERSVEVTAGTHRRTIGPLRVPAGKPMTARFLQSVFPPGMSTRVHSHPGPEAFYVVDGEQCMEPPRERRKLQPNEGYMISGGRTYRAHPRDVAIWCCC